MKTEMIYDVSVDVRDSIVMTAESRNNIVKYNEIQRENLTSISFDTPCLNFLQS